MGMNAKNGARLLGLLAAAAFALLGHESAVAAGPGTYSFQLLATVGDAIPSAAGGHFVNDFEAGGLANSGAIAFGADVSTGGEGVFLMRRGQITELARTGDAAPGGGTFDFAFLGPVTQNDAGDATFVFVLAPFTLPVGSNAGLYRYSHAARALTPIVIPFVTPAPGGGTFQGIFFQPTINNRNDVVFAGIVPTDQGIHVPGEDYIGLGEGIFRADARDVISMLVVPGDPAPGGGTFDFAIGSWSNDAGVVAFIGHVAGDEILPPGFPPQAVQIGALTNLYVRDADGTIRALVRAGDPAPGGGVFRSVPYTMPNNGGDIVFTGDLTPAPGVSRDLGVFLHSNGVITTIARPGDSMPGGGHLVSASLVNNNIHINNRAEVVFSAMLDSDLDNDGTADTGLFEWSAGQLRLIARSGTVLPGIGTIYQLAAAELVIPPPPFVTPTSAAVNNDHGQVLFQATLTNGAVVFLEATPAK